MQISCLNILNIVTNTFHTFHFICPQFPIVNLIKFRNLLNMTNRAISMNFIRRTEEISVFQATVFKFRYLLGV